MNTFKFLGKHLSINASKGLINQTLIHKSAQLCRPTTILCNSNYNLGSHQNFFNCFDSSKEAYLYSGLINQRKYYGYYSGRNSRRYKSRYYYEYEYGYEYENGHEIGGILYKIKMALTRSLNWLVAVPLGTLELYVIYPSFVITFAAPFVLILKFLLWDTFVYGPAILWHGKGYVIREKLKHLKAEEEEEEKQKRQESKKKKEEW